MRQLYYFFFHQPPNTSLMSYPKWASADNTKNVAVASSKFPMKGTLSGISSNTPNPGLRRYSPAKIPIPATKTFFIIINYNVDPERCRRTKISSSEAIILPLQIFFVSQIESNQRSNFSFNKLFLILFNDRNIWVIPIKSLKEKYYLVKGKV